MDSSVQPSVMVVIIDLQDQPLEPNDERVVGLQIINPTILEFGHAS